MNVHILPQVIILNKIIKDLIHQLALTSSFFKCLSSSSWSKFFQIQYLIDSFLSSIK